MSNQSMKKMKESPEYFGVYLNLARVNVYSVNNYIYKKWKKGNQLLDEEKIADSSLCISERPDYFSTFKISHRFLKVLEILSPEEVKDNAQNKPEKPKKSSPADEKNVKKEIDGHFAKLSQLSLHSQTTTPQLQQNNDLKAVAETIQSIFKNLNDYRNNYSHYFKIGSTNENCIRKIDIDPKLRDFLNLAYKNAIKIAIKRFDGIIDKKYFPYESEELINETDEMSDEILTFFISLFLDKESAFHMINGVPGLRGTQNKKFLAKREVFTAFCVKLPHEKFKSESDMDLFYLDVISELHKCPRELYNNLSESDKKDFLPKINTKEKENIKSNSITSINNDINDIDDYDTYIENITKKVRSTDRFYYFALKFLDLMNFNFLFQINLGEIYKKSYPKKFNGVYEERKPAKSINCFARLSYCLDNEEMCLKMFKESKENNEYAESEFLKFAPHYNIDDNKIRFIKVIENQDIIFSGNQPIYSMSLHELTNLIILYYLDNKSKLESENLQSGDKSNKSFKTIESLVDNFETNRKALILNEEVLSQIKNELNFKNSLKRVTNNQPFMNQEEAKKRKIYSYIEEYNERHKKLNNELSRLKLSFKSQNIPRFVLDYLLNIQDSTDNYKFMEFIKAEKKEINNKQKEIDNKLKEIDNKLKKINSNLKEIDTIKSGEIATFIARDIVNMISKEDVKKKFTSFYYNKLQEFLALFTDEHKNLISKIFEEVGVNSSSHPFFSKILTKNKNIQDYYSDYLYAKRCWICETFYFPDVKSQCHKDKANCKMQKTGRDRGYKTIIAIPDNIKTIPLKYIKKAKNKAKLEVNLKQIEKYQIFNKNSFGKTISSCIELPRGLFDSAIKKKLNQPDAKNMNSGFKSWWADKLEDGVQAFYDKPRQYQIEIKNTENDIETIPVPFQLSNGKKFVEQYKNSFEETKGKVKEKVVLERKFRNIISGNEKDIRLIKEKDMAMFLMLKFDNRFVNQKLKNYSKILDEEQMYTISITYNNIKDNINLKFMAKATSSGRYKRYIHDRRAESLLPYYKCVCKITDKCKCKNEVALSEIENEIEAYNKARLRVFKLIFELEKFILEYINYDISKLPSGKKDDDISHIQFDRYSKYLQSLPIFSGYINEIDHLKTIRNKFSHNQYPSLSETKEICIDIKVRNGKMIAEFLADYFEKTAKEVMEILKL